MKSRRANAVLFGFDFQRNAAIMLAPRIGTLIFLSRVNKLSVVV